MTWDDKNKQKKNFSQCENRSYQDTMLRLSRVSCIWRNAWSRAQYKDIGNSCVTLETNDFMLQHIFTILICRYLFVLFFCFVFIRSMHLLTGGKSSIITMDTLSNFSLDKYFFCFHFKGFRPTYPVRNFQNTRKKKQTKKIAYIYQHTNYFNNHFVYS